MIQNYGFTGANTNIAAAGNFFQYLEAPSAARGIDDRVTVFVDGANLGTRRPGDWLQLPRQAQRWQIQPVDTACVGVVAIGVGKLGTARVAGTVEVVDGGVASALAGREYVVGNGLGQTAAQNQSFILSNQSTNRVALRRVSVGINSGVNCRFQLRALNVGGTIPTVIANSMIASSKNLGAFFGTLWGYAATDPSEIPAGLAVSGTGVLGYVTLSSGCPWQAVEFTAPLIIGPGEGLLLSTSLQNTGGFVHWEGTVIS